MPKQSEQEASSSRPQPRGELPQTDEPIAKHGEPAKEAGSKIAPKVQKPLSEDATISVSRETRHGQTGQHPPLAREPGVTIATSNEVRRGHELASQSPPAKHAGVPANPPGAAEADGIEAMFVAIDQLRPNRLQPREEMQPTALKELTDSIRQSGILQPIAVRRRPAISKSSETSGSYEIIAGERRWRAAKLAGLKTVPVIVHQANDEKMLELALVENLQREDLNTVDRARAYRRFCDEFGLRSDEVARRVGEDRSTVANFLRLLDLPEEVLTLLAGGSLTQGHARALLAEPDVTARIRLAQMTVKQSLSVRQVEETIRQGRALRSATSVSLPASRDKVRSAHLRDLERRFEDALKTKVSIKEGRRKGSGRITIEYYSLDEFDGLAERLGVRGE